MKKDKKFIQGKVKPLQYGAKAVSIHKNSITFNGDYFNFVIASKKDGSGDYMYLDEYTGSGTNNMVNNTSGALNSESKKIINTFNGTDDLPF